MNRSFFALISFACAIPCLSQDIITSVPAVIEVTPEQVLSMLKDGTFLADVNEEFTYADAHLPGAKLLVFDAITTEQLPRDKTHPIVFYCYSPECPAAQMAAESTVRLGYERVYCMPAGITGWQDVGLRTEP